MYAEMVNYAGASRNSQFVLWRDNASTNTLATHMRSRKLEILMDANPAGTDSTGDCSLLCPLIALLLFFAAAVKLPAAAQETSSLVTTKTVLLPGTRFATESYIIHSGHPGPTVMIVGGVHGNEPAGAEAAGNISHWPLKTGRLIVIPRANMPGLDANKRLIPGLGTNLSNLNRNYPMAKQADNEARGELAQAISLSGCMDH